MEAVDRFHEHLDQCRRCREEVFNLCPVGMALLSDAARDAGSMYRGLLQWNHVVGRM